MFERVSNGAICDAMLLICLAKLTADAIRPPMVIAPLLGAHTLVNPDGGPAVPGPTSLPLAQWAPIFRDMPHAE